MVLVIGLVRNIRMAYNRLYHQFPFRQNAMGFFCFFLNFVTVFHRAKGIMDRHPQHNVMYNHHKQSRMQLSLFFKRQGEMWDVHISCNNILVCLSRTRFSIASVFPQFLKVSKKNEHLPFDIKYKVRQNKWLQMSITFLSSAQLRFPAVSI